MEHVSRRSFLTVAAVTSGAAVLPGSAARARPSGVMAAQDVADGRADDLLAQMTLEEKIGLVHGVSSPTYIGYVPGLERLGIPALLLTDGPAGIRTPKTTSGPSTAFPAPIVVAQHHLQTAQIVGALAALTSHTSVVGFVGGMDIPLIHKFEAGYRAGVMHVCPDCTVIAQYAGVTPEAFRNPGRGKELALSQYQSGVNVIFHASGSTGLGVFEAARQTGTSSPRW